MVDRRRGVSVAIFYSPQSTFIMKDYETAMLKWISQEVCDDLFAAASADNKIMVNNWVAFATLAIYREAASILDTIPVPSIDDCMAGGNWRRGTTNTGCYPKWIAWRIYTPLTSPCRNYALIVSHSDYNSVQNKTDAPFMVRLLYGNKLRGIVTRLPRCAPFRWRVPY